MTVLPTLRSNPCRVVGMPVVRAILVFTAVMPSARFHEKLSPLISTISFANYDYCELFVFTFFATIPFAFCIERGKSFFVVAA